MHKRIGLVVAMLLIVAMIVLPITGLADAGGFGGGSDFGGDWGGSSDWGDSDWGDSDWDSSYSGSGSSGGSGVYDLSDVVVTTSGLLRSENIDSLLTLVIPVIIPLSRYGLVLNVELNILLVKDTISGQNPSTYASCIGVSYSSRRIMTFLPFILWHS